MKQEPKISKGDMRSLLSSEVAPDGSDCFDNFLKWFGDSVVTDARGVPLVVFHGAPDVRGIFESGFQNRPGGRKAFFATSSYACANTYADAHRAGNYQEAEQNVIPLFVKLENPLIVNANNQHWKKTADHVEAARASGHDGIIIINSVDDYNNSSKSKSSTVYVFFDPSQAKSALTSPMLSRVDRKPIAGAVPNNGLFDPECGQLTDLKSLKASLDYVRAVQAKVSITDTCMGSISLGRN